MVWSAILFGTKSSTVGDTRVRTCVGAGIAISLAANILPFPPWELIRVTSERCKRLCYEQGLEEGWNWYRSKEQEKHARKTGSGLDVPLPAGR